MFAPAKQYFRQLPSMATVIALMVTLVGPSNVHSIEKKCVDNLECESSWLSLSSKDRKKVFALGEDYKAFMDIARNELSFVAQSVQLAKQAGFVPLGSASEVQPGQKYYDINRDRSLSLIVIGSEGMSSGFHVMGAHIDSPRLELKSRPLYAKEEYALFQTSFHGHIKNYQWTNIPLALMGRVDKKDGSTVQINIGMSEKDPVFMIADLSPHTDREYRDKKVKDLVKHEDLDPIIAHIPGAGDIEQQVVNALKKKYDISKADLVSAELTLVPAMRSRDMGLDRGLVAAYGQDDRLAGYAQLRAILSVKNPKKTAIAYLVDNEEVGNVNNTGAKSAYFTNMLAKLMYRSMGEAYKELHLRTALSASKMISVDVNPGVNPRDPSAWELTNAPRLGYGVNFKMYGQGSTANSEFTAWVRNLLDENDIPWQTITYKVGAAGGGTMGGEFSRLNIEVLDLGVPILSIHTPYSISSKVDLYSLLQMSKVFLEG